MRQYECCYIYNRGEEGQIEVLIEVGNGRYGLLMAKRGPEVPTPQPLYRYVRFASLAKIRRNLIVTQAYLVE